MNETMNETKLAPKMQARQSLGASLRLPPALLRPTRAGALLLVAADLLGEISARDAHDKLLQGEVEGGRAPGALSAALPPRLACAEAQSQVFIPVGLGVVQQAGDGRAALGEVETRGAHLDDLPLFRGSASPPQNSPQSPSGRAPAASM